MTESILVVGATGLLGKEIATRLQENGSRVRALVRANADVGKRAELERVGCEIATGDLKDVGSLDALCAGVDVVLSTASATLSRQDGDSIASVDRDGNLALIEAAERAGVGHFVFISFAHFPHEFALQAAKRAVEERLAESTLSYTILRPTMFMEVWLGPALGFDLGGGKVRIFGDGTKQVSWISMFDVVRFAVAAAATDTQFANRALDLGGPDPLSYLDIIAIFEETSGRRPEVESIPEAALAGQLEGAQNDLDQAYAALMLGVARGQVVDCRPALELLRGKLSSVRSYIEKTAASTQGG